MDATKKRKKDAEPPLITYEANNRTFDRLFKEDSLDGLKAVVRRKLNLAPSVHISLSQLRDGKSVDLEDDDDFEAFSASAHAASAVKVKVTVGQAQLSPSAGPAEVLLSSSKRKRKKRQKSSQNNSPVPYAESSKDVTPPETFEEAAHLSKKRRVSFVEALPNTLLKPTEPSADKSKKPTVGEFVTASEPETMANSAVDRRQAASTEPSVEKKKKKRKENEAERGSVVDNAHGMEAADKAIPTKEKSKKTSGSPTSQTTVVQPPDDSSRPAKSKKRRRDSVAAEIEGAQSAPKSSLKDPSSHTQAAEGEPPAKKLKDKDGDHADSEIAPIPAEPSKSARPKSKAQPETIKASGSVLVESKNESTKRKKKDKESPDASKNASSSVPKAVEIAAITEKSGSKKVGETTNVKLSKKSKSTEASAPEPLPSDNAEAGSTSEKSRRSMKKKFAAGEGNDQPQPTQAQPPIADADATTPKSKDGDKDDTTTAAPADAKTPKKSKKRKDAVVTVDVAEDNSLADSAKKPEASKIDRKEVTRLAVAAILSRKAAQAHTPNQPEASATVAQAVPSPVQPVTSSANIHHQADESAEVPATTSAEKSEPYSQCPICSESPSHVRAKCPTIKAGIRAMRKRMAELQAETSEDHKEERLKLISQLQTYIDKKTRKPRTSEITKAVTLQEPVPAATATNEEVQETPADPTLTPAAQPPANLESVPQQPVNAKSTTFSQLRLNTRSTPATQSSVNPKSPPTISSSVARSLSQPSIPPPITDQTPTSRKAPDVSQVSDSFRTPEIISAGPLRPDFLGLGDVSSYTDKDLEAIIRGPRMSVKDVPESDTEEEGEQEPEAVLEEDDDMETNAQRNASRVEYPTSSDEGDEDENEASAASLVRELETSSTFAARPAQERSPSSGTEEMQVGDMSFQDVEANGSSRELDRTGDLAANDAVEADLAPFSPQGPEPSQSSQGGTEMEADSDTAVASQTEGRVEEQETRTEKHPAVASPPPPAEKSNLDPIEPSEPLPPHSQPEPIASDDDHPMQSTPKAQVNLRTKRQRGKAEPNGLSNEAQFTRPTASLGNITDAGEGSKSTRKGRSLVKISEMPIPPNPSVRVIRPAPAPKTRRQAAQESQEENRDTDKAPEESNTRTTRSAAAAKAAATKTPAIPPAKASKMPAKAIAKTSEQASAKSRSKIAAANGASNTRTRPRAIVAGTDPEPEQPSQTSNTTLPGSQGTVASWAVLQESGPSQTDTETPPMVDELLPSPVIVSTGARGQKGQTAVAAEEFLPEPLFVPANSQQSFPYSQYPDLLHHKQASASPNESDDEEEVAAAVRRPAASGRQSSMFRGLSEIASQPTLFVSRLSQQFTKAVKEPVENLYGRGGQDSEESDSGSDSEAEKKAAASHIPASRRAGVTVAKKK